MIYQILKMFIKNNVNKKIIIIITNKLHTIKENYNFSKTYNEQNKFTIIT